MRGETGEGPYSTVSTLLFDVITFRQIQPLPHEIKTDMNKSNPPTKPVSKSEIMMRYRGVGAKMLGRGRSMDEIVAAIRTQRDDEQNNSELRKN